MGDAFFGWEDEEEILIDEKDLERMEEEEYEFEQPSFPIPVGLPTEELNNFRNELQNSQNLIQLKNPPIMTERTIGLVSSSAPQGFLTDNNFVQASLKVIRGNAIEKSNSKTLELQNKNPENQSPNNNASPLKYQSPIKNQSPVRIQAKDFDSSGFSTPNLKKEEINFDGIPWESGFNSPLKSEDGFIISPRGGNGMKNFESSPISGSVPHWKLESEMKKRESKGKSGNTEIEDYSPSKFDKFITIPTLSFSGFLSPETPCIRVGDFMNAKKRILITAGIHGDEPCGIFAFNQLLKENYFSILPGDVSVTALVGNPLAVTKRQRFIEYNLNRVIRKDLFKKAAYENERARVISSEINKCDILLDIHSCSASSPAHALPGDNPDSISIASRLPVGYVIKHLVHTTQGQATTVDWAINKQKVGICVECGQHDDPQTTENARNVIITLLDIVIGQKIQLDFPPPVILECMENEPVRKGFKFVKPVIAFERVPFGEVIAVDDVVGEIKSKYTGGTYIVMPTKKPVPGEEAWFYAKTVKS